MKINAVTHDLWRAVETGGGPLESIVTKSNGGRVVRKFLKKSMVRPVPKVGQGNAGLIALV